MLVKIGVFGSFEPEWSYFDCFEYFFNCVFCPLLVVRCCCCGVFSEREIFGSHLSLLMKCRGGGLFRSEIRMAGGSFDSFLHVFSLKRAGILSFVIFPVGGLVMDLSESSSVWFGFSVCREWRCGIFCWFWDVVTKLVLLKGEFFMDISALL